MRAEPTKQVVTLDVFARNLAQQHIHFVIESRVVGGCTNDETAITEDVAKDVTMVSLRHIVDDYVLHTRLRGRACNSFCHTLGVAVHRSVANYKARLGLITRQTVVDANDLLNVFVPHGTVSGADVVEFHVSEFLQGILHGSAVFSHDVGIVAHHLEPERVAIDFRVDYTAIQRAETTECIAREEHVASGVECHHRLWPMHHRREHEVQRVTAQRQRIAILHFDVERVFHTIEAAHHAERLLVADNLNIRIVFLHQSDGTAVVGFHVVDDQIVHLSVADNLADVLQVLREEVHFHGVYQRHLLIDNEITVVTNAVGQRPKAFEERLVAVVNAHVMNIACNLHICFMLICC